MKKTIDLRGFIKEFENCDRGDNFSPSGLRLLFDYLEYLEEEIGEELELEVIGFCCDFKELTFEKFIEEYSLDINDFVHDGEVANWEDIEEEELKKIVQDYLQDRTSLVGFVGNSVQNKSPLVAFTDTGVVFRVF